MKIRLGDIPVSETVFAFQAEKAVQAVAFLLNKSHSRRDKYMRVMKLLYIADRESIKDRGRPITGDRFVAMKCGPVLSEVLRLVKRDSVHSQKWDKFIHRRFLLSYHIELVQDPGVGKLCRYETDKLAEVWERYRDYNEWQMVAETHRLPEWQKNDPGASMKPISLADVLDALGIPERHPSIVLKAKESRALAQLFGG